LLSRLLSRLSKSSKAGGGCGRCRGGCSECHLLAFE
jgi:hypothetical protein